MAIITSNNIKTESCYLKMAIERKKLIIGLCVSALLVVIVCWYIYIFFSREIYWTTAKIQDAVNGTWILVDSGDVVETVVIDRDSLFWQNGWRRPIELEMDVTYYPIFGCFIAKDDAFKYKYILRKGGDVLIEYQSLRNVYSYSSMGGMDLRRSRE
jgi:hypothetical protein